MTTLKIIPNRSFFVESEVFAAGEVVEAEEAIALMSLAHGWAQLAPDDVPTQKAKNKGNSAKTGPTQISNEPDAPSEPPQPDDATESTSNGNAT